MASIAEPGSFVCYGYMYMYVLAWGIYMYLRASIKSLPHVMRSYFSIKLATCVIYAYSTKYHNNLIITMTLCSPVMPYYKRIMPVVFAL